MKKIFFVGCAAFALMFASCNSNKSAEQQATEATEQATEQVQAAKEEVKEVVNEVLTALQAKLADFKTKVEGSTKADAQALMTEATAIKGEIDAATLTEAEKQGLIDTFNQIIEICKNLK